MAKLMLATVMACVMAGIGAAAELSSNDTEFTLEIRSCIEGSGTVIKGGMCHVIDPIRGTTTYEFQVCAGLTLDAGIVVAGAEASTMLCGTLKVPVELVKNDADRAAWKEVARKKFTQQLLDGKQRAQIGKTLGGKVQDVSIEKFRTPDAATQKLVRKAIQESRPARPSQK